MNPFRALLVSRTDSGQSAEWKTLAEDDLMDGDVTVRITHSTINYKDGLAITGKSPVVRHWPMIPGIDFAGTVEKSESSEFNPGDAVLLNGWGCGETHYGGYAEFARVKSEWLIPVPVKFDAANAMSIGTAGYTAMLSVLALEEHGVSPSRGPVLVTGAAGGVGSIAVAVLAKLGFQVMASTGRSEEADFLKNLGATEIIDRAELSEPGRPIGKERWAGAVDVCGSHTLANVLAQTMYGGAVAACGLAQGMDLKTTVAPFILRSATLAGIDSVMASKQRRIHAYDRLARDLDIVKLESLTETRPVEHVTTLASEILEGKVRGRIVLEMG